MDELIKNNAKDIFTEYFKLRETSFDARNEIFRQLFALTKQLEQDKIKMEQEKLKGQAELDVMRLKEKSHAATLSDLEGMFRGGDMNETQDLKHIHKELQLLNERFSIQSIRLQDQITQMTN